LFSQRFNTKYFERRGVGVGLQGPEKNLMDVTRRVAWSPGVFSEKSFLLRGQRSSSCPQRTRLSSEDKVVFMTSEDKVVLRGQGCLHVPKVCFLVVDLQVLSEAARQSKKQMM